jgi:hypothetical protein
VSARLERIARAGWPVLAGVLLGLAAGAIWTLAQPERHRAEAQVLVRGASPSRAVPAVEALAESSLLEHNVAQTLHLSHPPRVSATAGEAGVLTLSVEAGSRDRARQIDAEAALVLTQLVASRFRESPVEATVLDPAHPVEQTSPTPGRNLIVAGLIGLVVGLGAAVGLARTTAEPIAAGATDPSTERRLKARVDAVGKRERALARRAGELAKREQELARREEELAAAAARPAGSPRREPEPTPVREPELPPVAPLESISGYRNIHALESLAREHAHADPSQIEEWNTYLFFLREHAEPDGSLPPSFDALVTDVFGDLVEARSPERTPS